VSRLKDHTNPIITGTDMISPPSLKQDDKVAIVSCAGRIEEGSLKNAIDTFEGWGLRVLTGKYVYGGYNQFSGTDRERAEDLQMMLNSTGIRAIFCSRGGYGTARIIDLLDFTQFISSPKWVIGYSDVTVLHSHINRNCRIRTIHGSMPFELSKDRDNQVSDRALNLLRDVLFGLLPDYSFQTHPLSKPGEARGIIAGGNLSVLCSLLGSPSFPDLRGKILMIEDVGEYLYHIDRMMVALQRTGSLDGLAGVVVGGFTGVKDNEVPFGKTAEEIISGILHKYDYPVMFGFPAGHLPDNLPLLLGHEVLLDVKADSSGLTFK
jgi:muramoyltetrapeptide carboxypeptidase